MNKVFKELKLAVKRNEGQHKDLFFYKDYSRKEIQEDMDNKFITLKKDKWSAYYINGVEHEKWGYFNVLGLDSDGKPL